jgi:hypothetical protein
VGQKEFISDPGSTVKQQVLLGVLREAVRFQRMFKRLL